MKKVVLSTILMLGLQCMAQNTVPEGAINGLFTINSDGDQVYFSKGNLQYQASTNTWRFAENQWDDIGGENSKISPSYDGWIDLFGWGTSGYNHGAKYYKPWSTETTTGEYWAYGHQGCNLYDQTGKADWGYNAISNGGNRNNLWRTLTAEEWNYLINERETASGYRYVKAWINPKRQGLIIFPDDWIEEIYSIKYPNKPNSKFETNTISPSDWSILESHGAVFLPLTGEREGYNYDTFTYVNGYYWSSSFCSESRGKAYRFFINVNKIDCIQTYLNRGSAVRLVQDDD